MANLAGEFGDAYSNIVNGTNASSLAFTMPGGVELDVESVVATIDNAAGGDTTPTLVVRDLSGEVIATKRMGDVIPAGGTGTATFSLRNSDDGGGIARVTSTDGTVTVTNPSGPVVDLSAGPVAPGLRIDYAEPPAGTLAITATTAATAQQWIVGNPITYNGATTVKIEVWIALASTDHDVVAELYLDGADVSRIAQLGNPIAPGAGSVSVSLYGVAHITPTAAAHTFEIRAWKDVGSVSSFLNPTPFAFNIFAPSFYSITVV